MLFVPLTVSEPEIVNIIISRASRYISHPGQGTIHILRQQRTGWVAPVGLYRTSCPVRKSDNFFKIRTVRKPDVFLSRRWTFKNNK